MSIQPNDKDEPSISVRGWTEETKGGVFTVRCRACGHALAIETPKHLLRLCVDRARAAAERHVASECAERGGR